MRINLPYNRFVAALSYTVGNLDVFSHVTYRYKDHSNPFNPITNEDVASKLERLKDFLKTDAVKLTPKSFPNYAGDFVKKDDGFYYLKEKYKSDTVTPFQTYTHHGGLIQSTTDSYPPNAASHITDSMTPITGEFSVEHLNMESLPEAPWSIPGTGHLGTYKHSIANPERASKAVVDAVNKYRTIPSYIDLSDDSRKVRTKDGVGFNPKDMYVPESVFGEVVTDRLLEGQFRIGAVPGELVFETDGFMVKNGPAEDLKQKDYPGLSRSLSLDTIDPKIKVDYGAMHYGSPWTNFLGSSCLRHYGKHKHPMSYLTDIAATRTLGGAEYQILDHVGEHIIPDTHIASLGDFNLPARRGSYWYNDGDLIHILGGVKTPYGTAFTKDSPLVSTHLVTNYPKTTNILETILEKQLPHVGATVVKSGDGVYVIGGGFLDLTKEVETYVDTHTVSFIKDNKPVLIKTGGTALKLYGAAAIVLGTKIYVIGGVKLEKNLTGIDIFTKVSNFNDIVYVMDIIENGVELSSPRPYSKLPIAPGVCHRVDLPNGVGITVDPRSYASSHAKLADTIGRNKSVIPPMLLTFALNQELSPINMELPSPNISFEFDPKRVSDRITNYINHDLAEVNMIEEHDKEPYRVLLNSSVSTIVTEDGLYGINYMYGHDIGLEPGSVAFNVLMSPLVDAKYQKTNNSGSLSFPYAYSKTTSDKYIGRENASRNDWSFYEDGADEGHVPTTILLQGRSSFCFINPITIPVSNGVILIGGNPPINDTTSDALVESLPPRFLVTRPTHNNYDLPEQYTGRVLDFDKGNTRSRFTPIFNKSVFTSVNASRSRFSYTDGMLMGLRQKPYRPLLHVTFGMYEENVSMATGLKQLLPEKDKDKTPMWDDCFSCI